MLAIGDDDEVEKRVEGIFEQTPLAQHVLEELDVLDAGRQLPAEIAGEIEALNIAELARDGALDDERSERAAPAAKGCDEHGLGPIVKDLRLIETQPTGGGLIRVTNRDALRGGRVLRVGGGDQPELSRPPVVQPDRHAARADVAIELLQHALDGRAKAVRRGHPAPERPGEVSERRLPRPLWLAGARCCGWCH